VDNILYVDLNKSKSNIGKCQRFRGTLVRFTGLAVELALVLQKKSNDSSVFKTVLFLDNKLEQLEKSFTRGKAPVPKIPKIIRLRAIVSADIFHCKPTEKSYQLLS